jgi:4-diphosphocytidyl-2-C-methyl-D-erythritol kinase
MEVRAPAKINLTLTVHGRRDDGFHEIDSVASPLALADVLTIDRQERGGLEFTCDDATIPADDTNLVVRAARLFCASQKVEPHLRIALTKRIPHGAGLGGGSSDAAATLLALHQLFGAPVELPELSALAAQIGSDVPLFLHRSAVRVRGRGELVEALTSVPSLPLLLIKPPFGVPTPWAYRQWKDSREIPGISYTPQEFAWGTLQNDLERPVFEKYLFLAVLKRWLLAQPEAAGALMSGSGATVFAVLRDGTLGRALAARMLQEFGPDLWCCETKTQPGSSLARCRATAP